MLEQMISLIGAAMILGAFGAQQLGRLGHDSVLYLILNLVGAIILGVIAARARQAGLTLVEGAWAIISLISLIKVLKVNRSQNSAAGQSPK